MYTFYLKIVILEDQINLRWRLAYQCVLSLGARTTRYFYLPYPNEPEKEFHLKPS